MQFSSLQAIIFQISGQMYVYAMWRFTTMHNNAHYMCQHFVLPFIKFYANALMQHMAKHHSALWQKCCDLFDNWDVLCVGSALISMDCHNATHKEC